MCALYRSKPVQSARARRGVLGVATLRALAAVVAVAAALPIAAVFSIAALPGCAASGGEAEALEEQHVAEARQGIAGGETDQSRRAVVAVGSFAGGGLALCTGTLIAPNLVLTAQHCVTPTPEGTVQCGEDTFRTPLNADSLGVSPATNALADGRFFAVSEVHVPSDAADVCGGDIALLVLDGEFPEDALPPIFPRLDEPVRRGEFYTAVGYGLDLDTGVGTRRALEGLEVTCGPLDCPGSESFTKTEFVGDKGICQGDSGGPALDPNGQVVGVVSRGTDQCDLAVYSAVAAWRDWIRDIGEQAYARGRYERPSWLTAESIDANGAPAELSGALAGETGSAVELPSGAAQPSAHDAGGCSLHGTRAPSGTTSPWAAAGALVTLLGCLSRRSKGVCFSRRSSV